jgi:transcriptional regulator with XRE-family HTH domain
MDLRVNPYAERLREARESANLTQVELAARLGVSPRTVQNWETGDRVPQAKHRRAIQDFLDSLEGVAA